MRRSKERAGVLQSAAKGHLVDLAVCSVAAHLAFVVWQNLRHCGTKKNLSSATGVVRKINKQTGGQVVFQIGVSMQSIFPVGVLA